MAHSGTNLRLHMTACYPYNHVMETEGGHIREYDDTVGNKRIHERHASRSGYEIFDDGTKVTRVKKDNYEIVSDRTSIVIYKGQRDKQ